MANVSKLVSQGASVYSRNRSAATKAMWTGFGVYCLAQVAAPLLRQSKPRATPSTPKPKKKVAIDQKFLKNLVRLLKILMPRGIRSREFWLLCAETLFLIARTGISLYVAHLDGKITSLLVKGEGKQFALHIVWWMIVGFPASFCNSVLNYLQKTIALRFRTRLNNYMLSKYLPDSEIPVYYSLHNLSNGVANPDQVITADAQKFASALSSLYANLAKPVLDMVLYTFQLSRSIGGDNVFMIGMLIQASASILRLSAPPFGEFVATEAALEGDFRAKHTRLIEYSEEIALYKGDKPEKDSLDRSYFALFKHINNILRHRLYYNFLEDYVIKYYWGALGLALCSLPIFFKDKLGPKVMSGIGERTEGFVTNRRLLLSSSDAFGRIMSSYKEISQLAGYTARVSDFIQVMDDAESGKLEKQLGDTRGVVRLGSDVIFDKVPIVSPIGDVLVKEMSFQVKQGQHLLIVGPNGCGKSSLFRVLGGLWPITGGVLTRPPPSDIFYIPQRPYLSRGTLRQQVIYPTTEENNHASDAELTEILRVLQFDDLVEQVGGWDAEREWREDLSMGTQQRIAAARLFYHKPKFAILDECTSSVTLDIETIMYTHAKSLGISLLTVSHRASLWKYHNLILQFDGYGGYVFSDLDAEKRLQLEEEKLKLDFQLRHVEEMRERLRVLEDFQGHEHQQAANSEVELRA